MVNILLKVRFGAVIFFTLAVVMTRVMVITSGSAPPVNCSCRCSWWTGDSIAQAEGNETSARLTSLLNRATTGRKDCAIQLNQTDIARVIDGRNWQIDGQPQQILTTNPVLRFDQSVTTRRSPLLTPSPVPSPSTTRSSYVSRRGQYAYGSDAIAVSTAALYPEAVDSFIELAAETFASFSEHFSPASTQVVGGTGGPLQERIRLNATEQKRLAKALLSLFKGQQQLLLPVANATSRQKRQTAPALCNLSQQTEACRLLELVKAGTLFLLPTIPESGISNQQHIDSSAFSNVLDMCAGRMARTLTLNGICIDANVLNAVGTFSIKYFGETSTPLSVKSLVGGIFPVLSAGGSPSILHRYGVAVDFACGMFEPEMVPDACLKIFTLCSKRAKQMSLPSLYMSVFAENFGCGGSSSYFDSVHCTLGSVDARALVVPAYDPNNKYFFN